MTNQPDTPEHSEDYCNVRQASKYCIERNLADLGDKVSPDMDDLTYHNICLILVDSLFITLVCDLRASL